MYMFACMPKWLIGAIRSVLKLKPYSHILRNSADLASALKYVEAGYEDMLFKVDVKDFFMSGSASELIHDVTTCHGEPIFDSSTQKAVSSALKVLLEHQYAKHPSQPENVRRVVKGTGQGLLHSGDVSDLALRIGVKENGQALSSYKNNMALNYSKGSRMLC